MVARRASRPATLQPAYVLHRYDWSESSLILDLFTREQGRIAAVAKGAKRPYSQLRGVLLPFQRLNISTGRPAADGTAEVQTLRTAEWAGGAAMLTGAALFSGFYVNELLMKLLARDDPHVALFDAYGQVLPDLAGAGDAQAEATLRAFELTLLQQTGVLPDLGLTTVTQRPVDATGRYALRPETGVEPEAGSGLTGEALASLQAALTAGDWAALREACAHCRQSLRRPLRTLIQHQLGDSVLRTRKVMTGLQRL